MFNFITVRTQPLLEADAIMALVERLKFKDVKDFAQQSFPAESGFHVETNPKFIIVPSNRIANLITTNSPAFMIMQEKEDKKQTPREYEVQALLGKAVHATYSLMLFINQYPLTKGMSTEEHIRETIDKQLRLHFPSFKHAQFDTTSEFLKQAGENIWFTIDEEAGERKEKIAYLFDQTRNALLKQRDHEEYIFGEENPPSDKYNELWLKSWEAFRHNGLLALGHLDNIFTNHLLTLQIHRQGIFSELALIQRYYNFQEKLIRVQINGRPDLIVAVAGISPKTHRPRFSHWRIYDFKNKEPHSRPTEEDKVDRAQLWLNKRALACVSYPEFQRKKSGRRAVSLEWKKKPKARVETYLVYAQAKYESDMIQEVRFTDKEEKEFEGRLYRWLSWCRNRKGILS